MAAYECRVDRGRIHLPKQIRDNYPSTQFDVVHQIDEFTNIPILRFLPKEEYKEKNRGVPIPKVTLDFLLGDLPNEEFDSTLNIIDYETHFDVIKGVDYTKYFLL